MSLSYAILGTGALGGYYGGQLVKSGNQVHFLLRSDYEHVCRHGLRVDTPDNSYTLTPATHDVRFYHDADAVPAVDVVLICLKTTQNHRLPELLPKPGSKRWKPGTVVVTLQNGLHPERDAAAVVGEEHVAGGLCFLCTNKVGPGHVQYLDYGYIKLGSHAPSPSGRMLEVLPGVAADFRGAGVECDVVDDLVLARWQKLVWNVPFNGLSVVRELTTEELLSDEHNPSYLMFPPRRQVRDLMQEVQQAAAASDNKQIDDAFAEKMIENTEKMVSYKTSMMLDCEAGRPMEIESIVGEPLRAAESSRIRVPNLDALYYRLLHMEMDHRLAIATILLGRAEIRLFQDYGQLPYGEEFCAYFQSWASGWRRSIRAGELEDSDWLSIWRGFADTIAPQEHGFFSEFFALLQGMQESIDSYHLESSKRPS